MSVSRTGVATVMPFFAVSTFVVMSVSRPVLAEDAGTEPLSLMPVIVKARHSDEALEDVPFTVNVIEAAQIERLSLPTLEAALAQTPGVDALSFGDNWSGFVRIRGVGSLGKAGLDDNSVVIYSDGMPQSMMSTSLDLLDVERVEVLKGPQGTLFGRGSEGGAITVRSRRPTRHAEGYLGAEVGTDAQRQATGAFGGPLGDTLSGRVAFRYRAADGVVTNQRDGEVLTKPEDYVVRGSLLWQPRQETALTLIAGHEAYHEGPSTVTIYPFNDKPVVDVPPGTQYSDKDTTRITAELTHAFGVANFTAVTGYSDTDVFRRNPKFDPLVMERLYGVKLDSGSPTDVREKLFNQELRLASLPSDPVFWVVGTNIYRSERALDSYDGVDNFNVASAFNADIYSDFDVDSYSVFGELTYPLRDNLKLTGGVRHTWDDTNENGDKATLSRTVLVHGKA